MNLFCFMLDGSTESIYEPANGQTNRDVSPKCRCSSGHLRCKPEWGGSDPSISSDKRQTRTKPKEESRRSCKTMEDETFAGSGSSASTGQVRIREPTGADPPTQPGDPAETTGRLKKLQKLVHMRNGLQTDGAEDSGATKKHDCLRHNGSVLTCIGLSRRREKSSSNAAAAASHPHQNARSLHGDPGEGGFWSPKTGRRRPKTFECPHARHRTPREPRAPDGSVSSPRRSSEWDRFESLVRELDRNQSDLSLSRMIRSLTDLQLSQSNGKQEKAELKPHCRETETGSDSKDIDASPEETRAAPASRGVQNDEAAEREASHRRSRNSLESLCSLKSGQSSSSGVTSGSNCSSNRESLRLEDDPASARRFCCRARVHTEFVPSPYDTESLALKVGDVIDVIAKPPMGTWTGSLNGRTGTFKFIYVDVLTQPSGAAPREASRTSTVQEALRRLGLQERASSPQRGGYQAADDPMQRREPPLAAVNSLQLLHSNSLAGGESSPEPERSSEDVKGDVKSRPRDSGCVMTEDAPLHFLSDSRT